MRVYHDAVTRTPDGLQLDYRLDTVAPLFAAPQGRSPRSAGYGWRCGCHGGPVSQWRVDEGFVTVSPADNCPRRRAVGPGTPAVKVRESLEIRSRPPVVAMIPPPPGLVLPPDVHRLIPRLLKLGPAINCRPWLTYSLHWWSLQVKIEQDDPELNRPPDADRVEGDERDLPDEIELPTGEVVKRVGRKTRDVAVLRESLALRAWPVGVVLWVRFPDAGEKWTPDGGLGHVLDEKSGRWRIGKCGPKAFKENLKRYETGDIPWVSCN